MKKIKHYALILLCTFSVSTMANEGPLADEGHDNSYFQQLKESFHNAETAQKNDVTGWISGRCFHQDTPNLAKNALLAGFFDETGEVGPGLDSKHRFAIIVNKNRGPNYFDNIMEEKRKVIREAENFITSGATLSIQKNRSLITHLNSSTKYSVRKGTISESDADEYLLVKVVNPTDDTNFLHYCYYFKKVREEY